MTRTKFYPALFMLLTALAAAGFAGPGHAQEPKKQDSGKVPEPKNQLPSGTADTKQQMTEIQRFCLNNAASAGDARAAWQAAKLVDLEQQIKQRMAELDAKRAEYEEWLKKRDEALKKAEAGIIAIYSRVRPDAAASQLSAMDDVMAASLLTKLPPRTASAILSEIEPGRAARLTNTMAGTLPDGKNSK